MLYFSSNSDHIFINFIKSGQFKYKKYKSYPNEFITRIQQTKLQTCEVHILINENKGKYSIGMNSIYLIALVEFLFLGNLFGLFVPLRKFL